MLHLKIYSSVFLFISLLAIVDASNDDWARFARIMFKLMSGLKGGSSLKGKTIQDLLDKSYNVAAAGGIYNFLKWPLVLEQEELYHGYLNHHLPNLVNDGFVEGFASHKASETATGTMVRYSLTVDDDIMLHFMYSAPYSFDFSSNYLALAACLKSNKVCAKLDAKDMYYNKYPFLRRKAFYYRTGMIGVCTDDVCIAGTMGRTHHAIILLFALPKNYYDLDVNVREKTGVSIEDYQWFFKQLLH